MCPACLRGALAAGPQDIHGPGNARIACIIWPSLFRALLDQSGLIEGRQEAAEREWAMPDEASLEEIRSAIEAGVCVPIAGAGVSIPAGADSWSDHLAKLAVGLPNSFTAMAKDPAADPTETATLLQEMRRREGLAPVKISLGAYGTLHQALAGWKCAVYLTTNYDNGLEQAILGSGGQCSVFQGDQLDKFQLGDCIRNREPRAWNANVIKLCSTSDHEQNTGIGTREEFASLIYGSNGPLELLESVLRGYVAVFVGCSLRDPLLNAVIDRCYASNLGYCRPFALLPDDASEARFEALKKRRVRVVRFSSADKTKNLADLLRKCKQSPTGQDRLLIFEPGTKAKLDQTLCAAASIDTISAVGLVTAHAEFASDLHNWGKQCNLPVLTRDFVVSAIDDVTVVMQRLTEGSGTVRWTSLVAPYELAVREAQKLALRYHDEVNDGMEFHGPEVVERAREKLEFRKFVKGIFTSHDWIRPIQYNVVDLVPGMTNEQVFERLVEKRPSNTARQMVMKPVNAAASIGVRPLDLSQRENSLQQIADFMRVMSEMPVNRETARCDCTKVLLAERILGEEFSVEGRRADAGYPIETLAVHWKVDIDADDTRFFERLFVTVPTAMPIHQILKVAHEHLLHNMGVAPGIFHTEFRTSTDLTELYPLEVGLRPGGGMVRDSVFASRGIDLFQALIKAAIGKPADPALSERVVATGLVFPQGREGGVLPLLRFEDQGTTFAIARGDEAALVERLRRLISVTSRTEAKRLLSNLLSRQNDLCRTVLEAFSERDELGLAVKVDSVEIWVHPGEIVIENEATYVAGLRIVANEGLDPSSAVAEVVAAMELCLRRLSCKPELPLKAFSWKSLRAPSPWPSWWEECRDRGYKSDFDSWTFSRGIIAAAAETPVRVLDLGCGSAKPVLPLIKSSRLEYYRGVDINPARLEDAKANFRLSEFEPFDMELADIEQPAWRDSLGNLRGQRWDMVVANLPYLPAKSDSLSREVNGGVDGLRYMPKLVIEVAQRIRSHKIVMNISSLSNLRKFSEILSDHEYGVTQVVAMIAPLEQYAKETKDYVLENKLGRVYQMGNDSHQIIFAFTLMYRCGISCGNAVKAVEGLVISASHANGTEITGVSCW
jgi:SAM-dependent methyltransferase